MGRSFAQFLLPNVPAEWVLQMALGYGMEQRMRLAIASPTQVAYWRAWQTWGEEWLSVSAVNAAGGANVLVEVWVNAVGQWSADPGSIFGFVPRRDMWTVAASFVARLGVDPNAVFRHL